MKNIFSSAIDLLLLAFLVIPVCTLGQPSGKETDYTIMTNEWKHVLDSTLKQERESDEKLQAQVMKRVEEAESRLQLQKGNMDFNNNTINWWLSVLGILVTIFGIGIPLLGFFYGRQLMENLDTQKKEVTEELKTFKTESKQEVKDFIKESREKIQRLEQDAAACIANLKSKEAVGIQIISDLEKLSLKVAQSNLGEDEKQRLAGRADEIKNNTQANPYEKDLADALSLYFSNKYAEAITKFSALINNYPKEITIDKLHDVYFYLGYAYQKLPNSGKAIEFFKKAIDLKPDRASSWNNLGNSYYREGIYEEAITCYSKAIEIDPNYHYALSNLGTLYGKKGNDKEAKELLQKVLILKPDYTNAYANFIEYLVSSNQVQEAEKILADAKRMTGANNFVIRFFEVIIHVIKDNWSKIVQETFEDITRHPANEASMMSWSFKDLKDALENHTLQIKKEKHPFIKELIAKIEDWVKSHP